MSIESEVLGYLQSKIAVTNLVSTRIYVLKRQKDSAYPCIVLNFPSTPYSHNLDGGNGIADVRVQIDCLSPSLLEAVSIAEAVRGILQGYRGTLVNAETISSVLTTESDLTNPIQDGSSVFIFRKMAEYQMKIRVSIPTF